MNRQLTTHYRGVVCPGLFSSRSTWIFNIAAEPFGGQGGVGTVYADTLEAKVADAVRAPDRFVIKSHMPSASIRAFYAKAMVPMVMTVRDPSRRGRLPIAPVRTGFRMQSDHRIPKGLVGNFTLPDLIFGGPNNGAHEHSPEIIVLLDRRPIDTSFVDPDRLDPANPGDGFRGFQLGLECRLTLAEIVRQIEFHAIRGDVDLGVVPMTYQLIQRSGNDRPGAKQS